MIDLLVTSIFYKFFPSALSPVERSPDKKMARRVFKNRSYDIQNWSESEFHSTLCFIGIVQAHVRRTTKTFFSHYTTMLTVNKCMVLAKDNAMRPFIQLKISLTAIGCEFYSDIMKIMV